MLDEIFFSTPFYDDIHFVGFTASRHLVFGQAAREWGDYLCCHVEPRA